MWVPRACIDLFGDFCCWLLFFLTVKAFGNLFIAGLVIKDLFGCFIRVLQLFQKSFSHIMAVSGCDRELSAHF